MTLLAVQLKAARTLGISRARNEKVYEGNPDAQAANDVWDDVSRQDIVFLASGKKYHEFEFGERFEICDAYENGYYDFWNDDAEDSTDITLA